MIEQTNKKRTLRVQNWTKNIKQSGSRLHMQHTCKPFLVNMEMDNSGYTLRRERENHYYLCISYLYSISKTNLIPLILFLIKFFDRIRNHECACHYLNLKCFLWKFSRIKCWGCVPWPHNFVIHTHTQHVLCIKTYV